MSATGNSAADIAAVQQRFLQLFAKNDLAGLAGCYTEDAQMMVANMDVIAGRSAIASVFKFTAVRGHTLDFRTHELDVHDGLAVEVGRYTRRRDDGSTFDRGKYMVIWKQVAGGWLIHRDMFSTSLAKTPALTPA
jgi:ketosteroid isomerase-like protein